MDFDKYVAMGQDIGITGKELLEFARERESHAVKMMDFEKDEKQKEREYNKEMRALELKIAEEMSKSNVRESNNVQKRPKLPSFDEKVDEIDSYLRRFERYATSAGWPREEWAMPLSALLTGRALGVYSRLSDEQVKKYDVLKSALLMKYDLTADGFRQKFRNARPDTGEGFAQFVERLNGYLNRWIEMGNVERSFKGLSELIIIEQLGNVCSRDLWVFLKERQPKGLSEMTELADRYTEAHRKPWRKIGQDRTNEPLKKTENGSNNEPNINKEWNRNKDCFNCGKKGHVSRDCSKPKGYIRGKNRNDSKGASLNIQIHENNQENEIHANCEGKLIHGSQGTKPCPNEPENKNLPMVSAVNIGMDNMPVRKGYIGSKRVNVLRDSRCSAVVVRKDYVKDSQLTGVKQRCVLLDGTTREVPVAKITVDTPFYVGNVEALVMENPIYDLILGNIDGIREPRDPDPQWSPKVETQIDDSQTVVGAVQTRAQKRRSEKQFRPMKIGKPLLLEINKNTLVAKQKEESDFKAFFQKATSDDVKTSKAAAKTKFEVINDVLHRVFISPKFQKGQPCKQVLVPSEYRKQVVRPAHDSPLSGHLGTKKTQDRIMSHFYWPGLYNDVKRFCVSCDVCQRTVSKGSIQRVPLGEMPLIDTPFKRVAVDIVGPIAPLSYKGNRYILILVDYAT